MDDAYMKITADRTREYLEEAVDAYRSELEGAYGVKCKGRRPEFLGVEITSDPKHTERLTQSSLFKTKDGLPLRYFIRDRGLEVEPEAWFELTLKDGTVLSNRRRLMKKIKQLEKRQEIEAKLTEYISYDSWPLLVVTYVPGVRKLPRKVEENIYAASMECLLGAFPEEGDMIYLSCKYIQKPIGEVYSQFLTVRA